MEALQEPFLVAMSRYCSSRGGKLHSATDEAEENKRLPDRMSASASGGGSRGDLDTAEETSDSNARLAVPSAIWGRSPSQSPTKAFASASLPLPSATELEESAVATLSQISSTPAGSKASDSQSSSNRSSLETGPSPVTHSVAPSPSPFPTILGGAPRVQRFAHLLHLLVDVRDVGVQCAAELLAKSAEKAHGQLFDLYCEMFDRVENLQPRRPTTPR